jgi:ribokinase
MKVGRLPSSEETLLGTRVDYGDKGFNQAVGCARLGAKVRFVARTGNDSLGQMALRLYNEEGIGTARRSRRRPGSLRPDPGAMRPVWLALM